MSQYRHAYLHGFRSTRESAKGLHFQDRLAADGIELELLDLNVPSFEKQTYGDILRYLDEFDADTPPGTRLCVAGSSMGGYLAARWAELHPDRVVCLFLLCPGFDLASRWPLLLGADAFGRWGETGWIDVEDDSGGRRPLHWEFVVDSRRHPAFPEVRCPVRLVHGTRDEVVPIELSRVYAADRDHVELVEVDDDHRLLGSLERLTTELRDFLDAVRRAESGGGG